MSAAHTIWAFFPSGLRLLSNLNFLTVCAHSCACYREQLTRTGVSAPAPQGGHPEPSLNGISGPTRSIGSGHANCTAPCQKNCLNCGSSRAAPIRHSSSEYQRGYCACCVGGTSDHRRHVPQSRSRDVPQLSCTAGSPLPSPAEPGWRQSPHARTVAPAGPRLGRFLLLRGIAVHPAGWAAGPVRSPAGHAG